MRVSKPMIDAAFQAHSMDRVVIRQMLEAALLADPITIKARAGLEAQYVYNDTFPGDDYDFGFTTLSEAWDNMQDAIKRVQSATPATLGGAVENLETARLIFGAALVREN